MTPLVLKLLIQGSATGALQALGQLRTGASAAGTALGQLDNAGAMPKTRNELAGVATQLRDMRGLATQAFSFLGVSVGVTQLVQLADAYSQMNARLRLATQYSGDFDEINQRLQASARATRSELAGTVDLYVKLSPALKGIGLNGEQAVGVITTINQAIGLSGVSAQAASAAIIQLGQGFGSGVLRGEELNSVMEQTPALAIAIADGLGVPLGELRKLGEEGKLTAEVVAGALQKMAPQLAADFAAMPQTVGQALTALRNEFLLYVGATDQAAGGTSALAGAINAISAEFAEGGPVVTAFSEAIKTLANGLDGTYRLLKIVGLGLGGYAAAAKAALTGDFDGARRIWAELGQDIQEVLEKPLITQPKLIQAATDTARKRELLEEQLKVQVEKLEQAKAFIAGKSSDSIAAKDKENIDKRIADQQRLVDAVRSAFQASLAEADKATAAAEAKRQKAGDYRQRGQDAAFNAGLKGLTPEQQAAAQAQRLQELAQQGNYESARARVAAIEGDAKKFEATAAIAEKKLLAALDLAEKVGDATAADSIGNELAKLQEAGAGLEDKKAAAAKAQAEAQAATLNQLQAQLAALQKTAREIEVQADVTKAETAIKGLQNQLAEIKDKTVTVTVNTVNTGGLTADQVDALAPNGEYLPARAFGGPLPGFASHDRADNMIYRGTPGEWVIQRPAVRYWGPSFLAAINAMRLPKFAFGGQLGASSAVSNLRVPSISAGRAMGSGDPAIFDLGALGRIRAQATSATAADVEAVIKRAALRFGRR
jgi:tape measure domain-containing protein